MTEKGLNLNAVHYGLHKEIVYISTLDFALDLAANLAH
jgi:hypothetical protein